MLNYSSLARTVVRSRGAGLASPQFVGVDLGFSHPMSEHIRKYHVMPSRECWCVRVLACLRVALTRFGNHYDQLTVACKGDKQAYGPEWGLSRRWFGPIRVGPNVACGHTESLSRYRWTKNSGHWKRWAPLSILA